MSSKNTLSSITQSKKPHASSSPWPWRIAITCVFLVALSLRVVYLSQIISTPLFHGLVPDSEQYQQLALRILKGDFTHREFIYLNPLYPFFLALGYLILGQNPILVAGVQALLDSLSCVLLFSITSTLFGRWAGSIAAFIYACYAIAIFYTGMLLAPAVVIFVMLLFIYLLITAERKGRLTLFFTSGVLFGVVISAVPNFILSLIFISLWFFITMKHARGMQKTIRGFLCLLMGFFTVMSLLLLRNYLIAQTFSPFSVHGGINFYIGNNTNATGSFMSPQGISSSPVEQVKTSIRYAEQETGRKLTASQVSRYWFYQGLAFIKSTPGNALLLYLKKCALFWRKEEPPLNLNYSLSKEFAPILKLPLFSFGAIAPFALLGIILSLRKKNSVVLLNLFTLSSMISVILFFISDRYRLPVVPFLIIYCAYGFCWYIEKLRIRKVKEVTTGSVVLILFLFLINFPFDYFKITPSSPYYSNLGAAYTNMGKPDEAIQALTRALFLDPHYAEAHYNLGNVYYKKGLCDKAIEEYTKALHSNPHFAEAHNNLGRTYGTKGMLDEAISEFRNALTDNPRYAEAYFNLGTAYGKKGVMDEAIASLKKAIDIDPDYAEAHYNLGLSYNIKGMKEEALAELKKAVTIKPDLTKSLP